jgi:hypothetical protein
MKKLFTFLFAILIVNIGISQVTFEKTYDNGSLDIGTSIITLDDGYIMCGATLDDANGDYDIFVTKIDESGEVEWTEIYISIGTGHDYANYINATSDGYFIITGNAQDPNTLEQDAFVLKIDALGNEIWSETYDGGLAENDGANYILEEEDGKYLICGYSYDGEFSDAWLFVVDDINGEFIVEFFYGLNGNDEAKCVLETVDGGLAIVGQSYDDVNGDYDGFLIKTDALGVEEWMVYTTGTANEIYNDIIFDNSGNFLIIGSQEDEANGDYDLLVENISIDGETVNYSYTFDYLAGDDCGNRIYTDGTDYFIAGYVEDIVNDDIDAYLAKIDVTTGDIIGDVLYGDIYDDEFLDFDFTTDNGFICIGYQTRNDLHETDVYVVKTDENGLVKLKEITQNENIIIYPNPTSDFINVSSNEIIEKIEIISIEGVTLISNQNSNSINIQNLPQGNYIFKITTENNTISKKVTKK